MRPPLISVMNLGRYPEALKFALGVRSIQVTTTRLEHIVNHAEHFRSLTPSTCHIWIILFSLALLPGARFAAGANDAPATASGEGRTFTGIVLDKSTHQPIVGATVILHREIAREPEKWDELGKPQEIQTDADGKFKFTVSAEEIANKKLCIATEVRAPGFTDLAWEGEGLSKVLGEIQKGEKPWFTTMEMSSGETVSGTILDPQGKPLAGCVVTSHSIVGDETHAGLKTGNDVAWGETKTDANGHFILNVIKGTELNSFAAKPNDFAVLSQAFGSKRGDLGAFKLISGQRISGLVHDADGKPAAGLKITAQSDKRVVIDYATERETTTDPEGKFSLAPVAPGAYQITVQDQSYLPVSITVADSAPAPIEFRPPPLNTINVHFVDSSGKPSKIRNRVMASAFKGSVWFHTDFLGQGAEAELRVPKGMENTVLSIMGTDGITQVWRIGNLGDWRRGDALHLGILQEPVTDVNVMEFKSPCLAIRATGPDGKPINKFNPQILYLDQSLRIPNGQGWQYDVKGDVGLEPSTDGLTWSTSYMLIPGREFSVWASSDGLGGGSGQLTLKEGEKREISIDLKPIPKQ